MQKPEVTVFMAVYNGEKFIEDAINSVLHQSFKDFELLIIDDGSTDNSISIIKKFSDNRIRLLSNKINLGLFRTRNKGIEEARGEYLAILDCDDIAVKNRLELQLKSFEKNKQAVANAGRIKYINNTSKVIGKSAPVRGDDDYIKALMLFTNIFINSTTMIKVSTLKKLTYREGFEPAEDYDLLERITAEYKVSITDAVLCNYRLHNNNISTLKSYDRKIGEKNIIERQLKRYGFDYNSNELATHLNFTTAEFESINLNECILWFRSLINQNKKKKIFNSRSFQMALARQWLRLCLYNVKVKQSIVPFIKTGAIKYKYLVSSFLKSV